MQFLDSIPIPLVFLILVVVGLLIYEAGFRFGRWYQGRTPGEQEGPTGLLVGSLLGMVGLLLAFSVGMATDRYEARRGLILAEANAIGTTYLRAGYLPAPYDADIRNALREYVPLQILPPNKEMAAVLANLTRSKEIQAILWADAEELARESSSSEMVSLFIDSLNEMFDLHTARAMASVFARVPDTVLTVLVIGGGLAIGMVGYNSGLLKKRSVAGALILIIVMAVVITLVVDLDRPRDGLIVVSQLPYADLQADIGPPQE